MSSCGEVTLEKTLFHFVSQHVNFSVDFSLFLNLFLVIQHAFYQLVTFTASLQYRYLRYHKYINTAG